MLSKLPHKLVDIRSSKRTSKKHKVHKPWWSVHLTVLWKSMCLAEKQRLKCLNGNRRLLKHVYVTKRKEFDRSVQRAKRQYIYQAHAELEAAVSRDSIIFWKSIGKIGIGNERLKKIPFEVKMSDGSVCSDPRQVLQKWGSDFENLLSPQVAMSDSDYVPPIDDAGGDAFDELGFNNLFTIEEVRKCIIQAPFGTAPGHDDIPNELLKNELLLAMLHSLFNRCYVSGTVPSE